MIRPQAGGRQPHQAAKLLGISVRTLRNKLTISGERNIPRKRRVTSDGGL
jgi:hypothetical protein